MNSMMTREGVLTLCLRGVVALCAMPFIPFGKTGDLSFFQSPCNPTSYNSVMNFEWKSKTHIKPVLVLGTSDTLKSVLTLQLIIGKCAKLGHTCDTGGSS